MPREPIAPAPAWPSLDLPLHPPLPPMEAERVRALPTTSTTASGRRWQYEPKWDGFRCLAFRDGEAVALQSKAGQPLGRYFPEVVEAVRALPIERCVLDGELVVPTTSVEGFDFDALLQRIHPADTRVRRLSRETPAIYLVFDLLVDARGRALDRLPLAERRAAPRSRPSRVGPSRARRRCGSRPPPPIARARRGGSRGCAGTGSTA
jgi:ATP-dependent DNA ligase